MRKTRIDNFMNYRFLNSIINLAKDLRPELVERCEKYANELKEGKVVKPFTLQFIKRNAGIPFDHKKYWSLSQIYDTLPAYGSASNCDFINEWENYKKSFQLQYNYYKIMISMLILYFYLKGDKKYEHLTE